MEILPKEFATSYQKVQNLAIHDKFPEADILGALLAPKAYMHDLNHLEIAFDKVLHHLEEAVLKFNSQNINARREYDIAFVVTNVNQIHRFAEELFHWYVNHCYRTILFIREENRKSIVQKFKSSVSISTEKPKVATFVALAFKTHPSAKIIHLAIAAKEFGDLVELLMKEWRLKHDEEHFFDQLAHIFLKVIRSKAYNGSAFNLINNTFNDIAFRDKLILNTVKNDGLDAGIEIAIFAAKNKNKDLHRNLKMIFDHEFKLIEKNKNKDYSNLKKLIRIFKEENFPIYESSKAKLITKYENYLKESGQIKEPIKPALIAGVVSALVASALEPGLGLFVGGGVGYYVYNNHSKENEKLRDFKNSI